MIKLVIIAICWAGATLLILFSFAIYSGYCLMWNPSGFEEVIESSKELPELYWEIAKDIWNWGRG